MDTTQPSLWRGRGLSGETAWAGPGSLLWEAIGHDTEETRLWLVPWLLPHLLCGLGII